MKSKVLASITALLALVFIAGCESVPAQSNAPQMQRTRETFSATKDRVWSLIVSQVGLDYPVRAIEKESGLLTTDWVTLPAGFNNRNAASWVVPPGGFLATWAGLRMNMKVMAVESGAGKTTVTINCHYEAFENNVQKMWVVATSNGVVENTILTRIERELEKQPINAIAVENVPGPTNGGSTKSASDSLMDLKKLYDAGAITKEEYDAKKKPLIEKL